MGKVTPWEVTGEVDYDKLVKEFGVQKINDNILKRFEKIAGEQHFMLRRKVFFAGRDLKWLLDEYDKGNKFFLYTGRAPSGPVHLGHVMPWVFTKWLQDKLGVELWFQFPDEEKYFFKQGLSMKDAQKWLEDNMLDVIALGYNPKKTRFLIDTKDAGVMYRHACRVAKRLTFSMVKSSFGMGNDSNVGSIFYTSMQAVPAFLPSVMKGKNIPCLIPHAIDQDPHFRLTRDILPKLGYYKPASIQCSFLPPLQGTGGKMSASDASEQAIFTTDTPEIVENKIMKYAFSGGGMNLKEHREKGGNTEVDVSYQYLRMLLEPDDKKLEKIKKAYESGEMLTGELKKITINKINDFLKKHQAERKKAVRKVDRFLIK